MQLAVCQGAKLDYVSPDIRAVQDLVDAGHLESVAILLELGVPADAALLDRAQVVHGVDGRARLVEAHMRGVVASAGQGSASRAVARRRLSV